MCLPSDVAWRREVRGIREREEEERIPWKRDETYEEVE